MASLASREVQVPSTKRCHYTLTQRLGVIRLVLSVKMQRNDLASLPEGRAGGSKPHNCLRNLFGTILNMGTPNGPVISLLGVDPERMSAPVF